jgi:hypothetical protein
VGACTFLSAQRRFIVFFKNLHSKSAVNANLLLPLSMLLGVRKKVVRFALTRHTHIYITRTKSIEHQSFGLRPLLDFFGYPFELKIVALQVGICNYIINKSYVI